MKSFTVHFCRQTHRLVKARQVNCYVVPEILCVKANLYFTSIYTNVLIIFMQIRYIEVFDLTNPRYNERIFSLGSSLNRGSTVSVTRNGASINAIVI